VRAGAVICVGVLCACLGAGLVLGVTAARAFVREQGPDTVSSTCAGAPYDLTVAPGPGGSALVTAQVVIHDDAARAWQVRWHGWEDQLPVATVATDGVGLVAEVFQPLGDLDDGPERTVWIRPAGDRHWCRSTGSLG
jgi:hypothetical protein